MIGTVQESASHQEQEGEDINRALNLEEVVQESSNEWQSISNVFRWHLDESLKGFQDLKILYIIFEKSKEYGFYSWSFKHWNH